VEGAMNVIWPDVADRDDLHIVGIDCADEQASLVAGADHRDAKLIANGRISKILAAGRQAGGGTNAEDALQKVATFELLGCGGLIESPEGVVEVFFPCFPFFRGQLVHVTSPVLFACKPSASLPSSAWERQD